MIRKLAADPVFRELVRAVVAYLEDPQEWEKEVEKIVRRSIPAKDIDRFKKEILRRNPGMSSLADYFDIVGPKNPQKLGEMVKSLYEGVLDPARPLGKPLKERSEMVTEIPGKPLTPTQKEIQKLRQENLEWEEFGRRGEEELKAPLEETRAKRPSLRRTARLNVINTYLDSLS